MQGVKTGLLMFLLPPVLLAGDRLNMTSAGGSMRFQGVIIAEPCRVEAGDQKMAVNMGQLSSNRFHSLGEEVNPVPFDIHLRDCSATVIRHLNVSFHGVADGKNPNVLSVGEGPGIATGVGIALFDKQDLLIPLNSPPDAWRRLRNGPSSMHFVARYRATGKQVTGGAASAQVWFSLTYQ